MSTEIVSVRLLLVAPAASLRAMLRQGASQASVPAEIAEANSAAAAALILAKGSDLVLLDAGMPAQDKDAVCKAARACKEKPLVFAVGEGGDDAGIDGSIRRPADSEEAQVAVEGCIRARLPARALIVDVSATTRGIVRKILSAGKFPLNIVEAHDGHRAVEEFRRGYFDIVFMDCNMPGVDGFLLLAELRKQQPHVAAVMMSPTDNVAVAERAKRAGAADFLKKPFFPADVDRVFYRLYGIEAPTRAG